jgi:DNA-binding response OmpR family regulator
MIQKGSKEILSIVIVDTGVGISDEEKSKVFTPFYQSKQTVEGQMGSGIGLSLVKELVSLYNGTISFQSTVGVGTTFIVELPAYEEAFTQSQINKINSSERAYAIIEKDYSEVEETTDEDAIEESVHAKDSVVIVEDNNDLRHFIASILKEQFVVYSASDGEEALYLTLQHIPNLVLSDLMMPKMDGIKLTNKIKADERTSHIPVILLTAKNEHQSRLDGLKTGADDYLTKPFSNEELLVRIHNLIEQRKLLAQKFRERILVPITPNVESSMDDKFLQKIKTIVEENLSEFSFTVEQLANEMTLSRTQLLRKLKALTGLSPNEFIKELRLKKAADMISNRIDTVTQIGYSVGFNDQSYFTKCFKKRFGITPTSYLLNSTQNKSVPN